MRPGTSRLRARPTSTLRPWLGRPGVFLNTVGDVDVLPRVLDAAERFERRPGDAQMAALLERVKTAPLFV